MDKKLEVAIDFVKECIEPLVKNAKISGPDNVGIFLMGFIHGAGNSELVKEFLESNETTLQEIVNTMIYHPLPNFKNESEDSLKRVVDRVEKINEELKKK